MFKQWFMVPAALFMFPEVSLEPVLHSGRIMEGQYEYSELNDRMSISEAVEQCDSDLQCAGFTFKGPKLFDAVEDVYFFHVLLNINTSIISLPWNYYKTEKEFVVMRGTFSVIEPVRDQWTSHDLEGSLSQCKGLGNLCVGVTHTKGTGVVMLSELDFDSYRLSRRSREKTYIKTNLDRTYGLLGTSVYEQLDLCCPKIFSSKQIVEMLQQQSCQAEVGLDRVPCTIDHAHFHQQYNLRRRPVLLEDCTKGWKAREQWSLEYLLSLADGNPKWSSATLKPEPTEDVDAKGSSLRDWIQYNGTITTFERLNRRKNKRFELKLGRRHKYDKREIFQDYSQPAGIPPDIYNISGIFTNFQWVIVSDTFSGSHLHIDIHKYIRTTPWNTLLTGQKWWVLMPLEVDPKKLHCDKSCSESTREMSWFMHVLPQLRNRKFYGRRLVEFLQNPGDTIYMPGPMAHAVLNTEDNISITENIFLEEGLYDYIFGSMLGEFLLEVPSINRVKSWEEEIFWKNLYYKVLDRDGRKRARGMIEQIEQEIQKNPQYCDRLPDDDDEEDEEDKEEEEEEEEDEDDVDDDDYEDDDDDEDNYGDEEQDDDDDYYDMDTEDPLFTYIV